MTAELSEEHESLWFVIASPLLWGFHFLFSYWTAAVWCARFSGPDRSLEVARIAIAVYTALALLGVAFVGYRAYGRHRLPGADDPHAADTAEGRHRFLGFAALLLSGLSAVAIAYSALAALLIRSCD